MPFIKAVLFYSGYTRYMISHSFQALIALWIPGAIFGGMCLLVVILALRLPESMQYELPSTMKARDKWKDQNGKTREK